MTGLELLEQYGPLIGGALAGVPPWVKLLFDSRKTRADLVAIATDAAASVIEDLRREIDRHKEIIADLESQTEDCRAESAKKEARIAELEAVVSRLRNDLRAHEAATTPIVPPRVSYGR